MKPIFLEMANSKESLINVSAISRCDRLETGGGGGAMRVLDVGGNNYTLDYKMRSSRDRDYRRIQKQMGIIPIEELHKTLQEVEK